MQAGIQGIAVIANHRKTIAMNTAIFRLGDGAIGSASTPRVAMHYLKKESKDVPSPQTQRSHSQSPLIANIASVIAMS